MPKKTPLINDFRAGELTPDLDARIDLKDYYRGCRILENMMPIIEGGVARMPGSYYVRPVKQIEEGWSLRVTKSGSGTGTVTSDLSPGIDCGSSCYFFFLAGSTVVLTATPDTGKSFVGWSGDGTGTTTRTVIMNGNKVVNAEFSAIIPQDPLSFLPNADTWIASWSDIVRGAAGYFYVYIEPAGKTRCLIRFDFSALPSGAVITSASLQLRWYDTMTGSPVGRTYWMYELTQPDWTEMGAIWTKYDGTNTWITAGGDYITTNGASIVVEGEVGQWLSWNVLDLVKHFQASHGKIANFLLREEDESHPPTRGPVFKSKESGLGPPDYRPLLTIWYSI